MKYGITALLVVLLSGCASIYVSNIADDARFADYVGKSFPLKDDALICKDGFLGDAHAAAPTGDELVLSKRRSCHYGGSIAKVEKGTIINIEEIVMHHHFPPMWRHIYFIGSIAQPDDSIMRFWYFYGFDGQVEGKLPWNKPSV